jgi:hypothetical protein
MGKCSKWRQELGCHSYLANGEVESVCAD